MRVRPPAVGAVRRARGAFTQPSWARALFLLPLLLVAGMLAGASSGPENGVSPDAGTAQVADAERPTAAFPSRGSDVTWTMALVVYEKSASGAVMPFTPAAVRRRDDAIRQFQREALQASEGRFGVAVDVFVVSTWPGARPSPAVGPGLGLGLGKVYDVTGHMYPRFDDEPMVTDIGVDYQGLAGVEADGSFFHEYPVSVDGFLSLSGALLWHETLHTATQYLQSRALLSDGALPPGDVHGRPARYPSERAYLRDYLTGEVTSGSRTGLGLGVDVLVRAGAPRDAHATR